MNIEDAIKKRKSIRRYSDSKPDWRKIIKAIDASRYAPMAGNLFSLRFILVQDKDKIVRLKQACQQDFVGKAHYIVVVVSDITKVKMSYGDRTEKFARQQAGAGIENFLLELTRQGLCTCWTGYFVEEQVKRILEIPDNMNVEALFPIGIETRIPTKEKPKPDLENVLWFDKWKNKYMKPIQRARVESV